MEAERPALLLEPPADVDVVAGGAVLRIEAADGPESAAAESHVAARNVLGHLVAEQDVGGPAGRVRDALGDRSILGRHDVRTADAHVVAAREGASQVLEPLRIRVGVVVGVGDDRPRRRL
jgi:hypothetical protein